MKTLANKIADVIRSVKAPAQSGYHTFNRFHYSTRDDIFMAIRGELASRGVAAIPSVELLSLESAGETKRGGSQMRALVRVTMTLIDSESGETLTQQWVGEAVTSDDKGIQGAATQAIRFWAVNTFMLCDGSDEQIYDKPGTQATAPAKNHQVKREEAPPADPRRALVKRLYDLGLSEEQAKLFGGFIAKHENVESARQVSDARMRMWLDRLKSKADDDARQSVLSALEQMAA